MWSEHAWWGGVRVCWGLCWAGLCQSGPYRPSCVTTELGSCWACRGCVRAGQGSGWGSCHCLQQPEVTDSLFLSAQVGVCFSLSLELLSYQRLPADQMLPGVDIQQSASGEREMVFTQDLLLEYTNHTTQVSPRPAPHTEDGGTGLDSVFVGSEEDKPQQGPSEIRGAQALALEEALPHGEVRVIHLYLT